MYKKKVCRIYRCRLNFNCLFIICTQSRILANRQSAQRSRVRKLQYISELERSVTSLQVNKLIFNQIYFSCYICCTIK